MDNALDMDKVVSVLMVLNYERRLTLFLLFGRSVDSFY